ncbi:MFS transporter [Achromobacter aloeverae]|uniref:MFS transporter n=1 Tax=Achromobacter aloeverae TaxID=1750518 RepID=A0A4Q1HHX6_9BURK|nr:MFS transporter [Achromobacter aloeverae]RXN87822.1 MFS transporter [Achromobacter aloeverae]
MTKPRQRTSILATTIAASFGFGLVQLDVTIVNVALPTIARTLDTTLAGLQWVVDAYALVFAALLLTGGYLGDRYGAKPCYLAGIAFFALASLACGMAASALMLIAGRVLQGVGAALMLPCSLALINHAAQDQPRRRAQAIGWWTAAGGIMIAAGPIVGGLLLGVASWRAIFLVNLPVCAVGGLLALRVVETRRLPKGHGVDIAGPWLAMLALGAVTGAMIEARPLGMASPVVLASAATGILALLAFVRHEARAASPMLPLSLFDSRTFRGALLYGAIVNLTYYGAVFVLSVYLQRVLGYTPVTAGLAFLPLTATFLVVNVISGWWVGARGSRAPMIVGALIDACGFALLALIAAAAAPYWKLAIAFVLIPAGMGLGVPAMTTAVLVSVEQERSGVASAVLNAARQAAGAMGVALFGALAGDTPAHIVSGLGRSAVIATALLVAAALLAARAMARSR